MSSTVRRSARSLRWVRTWTGPPGEQPVGLAGRQAELAGGGRQRRPGPAVEDGLGRDGVGQPVAQGGVGVARSGRFGAFSALMGGI